MKPTPPLASPYHRANSSALSLAKQKILVFQILLFSSILLSILAGLYSNGALAAFTLSSLLCAAAFAYYVKELGFDVRALFACVLFYFLALFFIAARFLSTQFSFSIVPIAALAFSGLVLAFRLLVFNKSAEGVVVGAHGRFLIVEVLPSPWNSLSGVQAVESANSFAEGTKVRLAIASGLFSPPRISRVL